jgi:predicted DNA-binding transcriptional regulator YafY
MSETSARLLSLLSLLQTPREWPGSELARRLGVSARTVRRDVDRLRDLGYPVQASMGAAGGYRLVAGTALPPLLLDDEEAVAIAVGLRTAAGHAVDGIEEASLRALAKLQQVLPARLRHRVGALGAATAVLLPGDGPGVDPADLAVLATAATGRERLRFAYQAGDGAATRRHTEPHSLVSTRRRWYLVAYDLDRDDWRTFRVDRISEPFPTGARAAARELPDADAAAFVARQFSDRWAGHRAVATVHAPAEEVRGKIPGDVEPVDADTCRVHTVADSLDWLALRLALLGRDFEVHEPPELAGHLSALAARLERAAAHLAHGSGE